MFVSERGGTLTYYAIRKIFLDAAKRAGIERKISTHLFRKSRGTHLIEQGLPIANVVELMWGNQSTRMIQTYIRISPVEQDRVLLKHAGVITDAENKQQERRLFGVMCSICHTQNSPTARYCSGCGTGLTTEAMAEEAKIRGMIREEKTLKDIMRRYVNGRSY